MEHCYLIVTDEFVSANDGAKNGCNVLAFATTTDGRKVCSLNCVNEFPEIFNCIDPAHLFPFAWLTPEDFPTVELPSE